MTKQYARKLYREKRLQLTTAEQSRFDDLVLIHFQSINLPPLHYVHTYLAMKENREMETDHLLHYLEFRNPGMKTVVPRVNEETQSLDHIEYDENVIIAKNKWKIPEPVNGKIIVEKEIDLIFVPLLAFDTKGSRVGYGKGYYDKFLSLCRPGAFKIGLSYFDPLDIISDTEQFDIPLDYCVTPQSVYEFG